MMHTKLPILRPLLPNNEQIKCYFDAIDQTRWYSNGGHLVTSFEDRLAQYFQVETDQVTTVCNGTLALTQFLRFIEAPRDSLCLMPSWTFVATAAAALAAGMTPYFLDVNAQSWLITPEDVKDIAKTQKVGAVIVVSPFGALVDLAPWDALTEQTGIKVIIDAAAGFDSFRGIGKASFSTSIMISFHATKVSGIGEGAALIAGDRDAGITLKAMGNFGFSGSRQAILPGINAKISEYAGALGNAFLDTWEERRAQWSWLKSAFLHRMEDRAQFGLTPDFKNDWVSSYGQVLLPGHMNAENVIDMLAKQGIEARKWWGDGCHRQAPYQSFGHNDLTETDKLANQLVGLPYWIGMNDDDFDAVFHALDQVS